MNKTSSFLRLIQRLIISSKQYFKETLTSDVPNLTSKILNNLIEEATTNQPIAELLRSYKTPLVNSFSLMIQSVLTLQLSVLQVSQLSFGLYNAKLVKLHAKKDHTKDGLIKGKMEKIRK
jgi:hypothetical protein